MRDKLTILEMHLWRKVKNHEQYSFDPYIAEKEVYYIEYCSLLYLLWKLYES